MVSTSSGGNRLPVVHRALISKKQLDVTNPNSCDVQFIKGQLKLNDSLISISETRYNNLSNIKDSAFKEFFEKSKNYFEKEIYYSVEEAKIRDIDVPSDVKTKGISILRECSNALKYNKVSSKTEEIVFRYIAEKDNN